MEITFDLREFGAKVKSVILSPRKFYHEAEKERNWKEAFSFSIAVAIIASVFGMIEIIILYPIFSNILPNILSSEETPQLLDILPAFFISTVMVVLLAFVWTKALHIWFKFLKYKGEYWGVYRAFVYSRAPIAIFGWVPYVGGLFGLYSLYVLAVGLSVHYNITLKKALLLLLPPIILLFVVQTMLFALAAGNTN